MEGGHEAIATTIDERIVEMRFDNKQFESGIQTSLSSLEKLKQSLNLSGAAKGLEEIDHAAQNCRVSPLGDAVDTVKLKFSALEVMAVTALANITNSVINTGKQMIKSLTIDPIKDGFDEYELKMDSVQNIMNGSGESLETVMGYLEELNTYADKTIYSFSDMTSNIGKFTNSGVNLKDAVKAIQGVSNVAAVSGANTQEASRAMYNFAQALSAGSVKLIDWKSIENANMATVEFKNELLKTAVELGTVKKQGDKYVSTTKDLQGKVSDAFDATSNFNDSLSHQWMTTDVLIQTLGRYSDETTEIGKKAFAAAQDVKTFSQLMDTLKEAVGSGWATTWELIFGDYNEAKALWTEVSNAVGGVIDRMSQSRNALLKEWKDLGGRTAMLDAFRNAIKGLLSFVTPVKDAFRDIFPSVTGKRLAEITKNIRDFTAQFKIGGKSAENLKNTFKGFFAVLDIGAQALSAIFSGITSLLPVVPKLGGGFLNVTGGLGELIVSIDDFLKRNKVFQKAVDGVVNTVKAVPTVINLLFQKITGMSVGDALGIISGRFSEAFHAFKEVLDGFKGLDTSGIDSISDKIKVRFAPLSVVLEGAKRLFQAMVAAFGKLAPIFATLATRFGEALGSLGDALNEAVTGTDFNGLLDIFNSGVIISIGLGLKNLIDNLAETSENAGGIVDGIKEVIGGVTDCLSTMQQNLKADILKKIAVAIGILTASVLVLSLIDSDKLSGALAALTGEFINLFASMAVFQKLMDGEAFNGMNKVAKVMVTMSAAVLILSFAMKNLASLDWNGVAKGLVGISGLSAVLIVSAKALSESSGKLIKGAAGLVIFALAIRTLVKPVKELGSLNADELMKGLVGVSALCLALALFLKGADLDKSSLGKGLGLMALAEGVNILATAAGKFAALSMPDLAKGLTGVTVILAELVAFTHLVGSPQKMISTATGMVIIGSAMLIFAKAIQSMGSLSTEQIGKGLVTMSGAFLAITLAINALPATTPLIAAGLVLVGAALNLMAVALGKLGEMSWGEIGKSMVALAGALTIIAVAVTLMIAALPGAAALVVVAGALAILTPVLKLLGSMSLAEIGKGLLALAGAFAVIGVAGLLLAPIVPVLLALGAAILLLSTGVLACGVGITALATGMTALAVAGTAGIMALVFAIEALLSLIPQIAVKMGEGFVAMLMAIGNMSEGVCTAVVQILLAVIDALVQVIPPFVNAVLLFITTALEAIAEYTPRIVQAGIDIVIGLIEGLAQGIDENADRIKDALTDLFNSLIELALTLLGIHSPSTVFKDMGTNIIQGLINGLEGMAEELWSKAGEIVNGLSDKASEAKDKVLKVISDSLSTMKSKVADFKEVGKNLIGGLKQGITEYADKAVSAAKCVVSDAVSAAKNLLGIHSPSKVFSEIGRFTDEGFALGLSKNADSVIDATESVGMGALSALSATIAGIADILATDIDTEPTIRPVLDLSDIQNGVKRFHQMMPKADAYSLDGSLGLANRVMAGINSGGAPSYQGVGGITINNTFNGANNRDGMAIISMLNRELGGAL